MTWNHLDMYYITISRYACLATYISASDLFRSSGIEHEVKLEEINHHASKVSDVFINAVLTLDNHASI